MRESLIEFINFPVSSKGEKERSLHQEYSLLSGVPFQEECCDTPGGVCGFRCARTSDHRRLTACLCLKHIQLTIHGQSLFENNDIKSLSCLWYADNKIDRPEARHREVVVDRSSLTFHCTKPVSQLDCPSLTSSKCCTLWLWAL